MGWLVTGLLLLAVGLVSEAVLGSFEHVFDWRWPKERYPQGGNHVRVLGGRVLLMLGLALLLAGAVSTLS